MAARQEIWKPVKGFKNVYSVSNRGRVRSERDGRNTFVGKILKPSPTGSINADYHGVNLCRDGKSTSRLVHVLVAEAFLGPRPTPTHQVNHKNGKKRENRVENLEWATPLENQQHRYESLRQPRLFRGAKNPQGKLTERAARTILKLWAERPLNRLPSNHPLSLAGLAERFGVKPAAISRIVRGETWKHLL